MSKFQSPRLAGRAAAHQPVPAPLAEAVGAGDDGEVEVEAVEVAPAEGVGGEDEEPADGAEVAPVALVRDEADRALAEDLGRVERGERDLRGAGHVRGRHDGVERPAHVLGDDGLAVAPARAGVDLEGEGEAVVGDGPAPREGGGVLAGVGVAREEALVEHRADLRGEGGVLEVVVEALRGGAGGEDEPPALRRVGVRVAARLLGPPLGGERGLRAGGERGEDGKEEEGGRSPHGAKTTTPAAAVASAFPPAEMI